MDTFKPNSLGYIDNIHSNPPGLHKHYSAQSTRAIWTLLYPIYQGYTETSQPNPLWLNES